MHQNQDEDRLTDLRLLQRRTRADVHARPGLEARKGAVEQIVERGDREAGCKTDQGAGNRFAKAVQHRYPTAKSLADSGATGGSALTQ